MLSEKQIYILNKNKVFAHQEGGRYWYFTINGQTPHQSNSNSEEGALKKAIGYLFNKKNNKQVYEKSNN
ncbi:MAG: hypothetical protein LBT29_04760 [Flavobacteriaceae bacterium]|jgi:hypothetical protein|nr:hypothetical protein [Flavobacteriaceae bacterium]